MTDILAVGKPTVISFVVLKVCLQGSSCTGLLSQGMKAATVRSLDITILKRAAMRHFAT